MYLLLFASCDANLYMYVAVKSMKSLFVQKKIRHTNLVIGRAFRVKPKKKHEHIKQDRYITYTYICKTSFARKYG